jgi:hypothetical protein
MTEIKINVDGKLLERFNWLCNALELKGGIVGFLEAHASDAIVNKLADLAEQFEVPWPEGDASKASYYPKLAGWLAKEFEVKLATIEKAVRATPGKVLNFPEKASEYLVTLFGKPGDDPTHWMDIIVPLIQQDEDDGDGS